MKKIERYFLSSILLIFSVMALKLFPDTRKFTEYLQYRENRIASFGDRSPDVEPVNNALYLQECSDCHIAYSRGLLPERSWRLLMQPESLSDHFEEVLEFEEPLRKTIEEYLVAGSVEKGRYYVSRKIQAFLRPMETPIRISRLRYIWNKHRDLPEKYISGNAKVISLSQCSSCHRTADRGIFDEDEVYIPFVSKP